MDKIFDVLKFKKWKFLAILIFVVTSNTAHSQLWSFGGGWSFPGCTEYRGTMVGYCELVAKAVIPSISSEPLTVEQWHGGPLSRIDIFSSTSANCVFNGHSQFNYYTSVVGGTGCAAGEVYDTTVMACIRKAETNTCKAGNPIEVATGSKVQEEIDKKYLINNHYLYVKRFYNSRNNPAVLYAATSWPYGGNWRFIYTDKLSSYTFAPAYTAASASPNIVEIFNPEGPNIWFNSNDGISWQNRNGGKEVLEHITAFGANQWKLRLADTTVKTFDSEGKLINVTSPEYGTVTVDYSNDFLNSVGPRYVYVKWNGTTIFSYEYIGKDLVYVINSTESPITYSYDSIGNLTGVQYSDATQKNYHYEDPQYKKLLTGVTNELGVRYATWSYDTQGRAISSVHANGVDNTTLTFNADGSTTVTNALNKQTIYRFSTIAGAKRVIKVEGQPTTNCVGANQDYTYTPEGWIASKTDWKGVKTTFGYNTKGQETSRIEADGTTEARTITTTWDPVLNVKTKVTEPETETTFTYDANGLLKTQSVHSLVP